MGKFGFVNRLGRTLLYGGNAGKIKRAGRWYIMRTLGTQAKGIRTPIIRQGDDLVKILTDSLLDSAKTEGYALNDRDVVGVTEAVVARAQGNYAHVDQIAADIRGKFGGGTLGVVFPIMSRNRFSILLKGIAMGAEKVIVQFSYPSDEVGNRLVDPEEIYNKKVNPYTDSFDEKGFRDVFGYSTVHRFTGVDYIESYKELYNNIEVVFSNDPAHILKYTSNVLACDIHTRELTKKKLKDAGAKTVYGLDDILSKSKDGSGYNPQYGLLGSNKATEETVKLFPREADVFVNALQKSLHNATGKNIDVMVYGDGAFKDPAGGIWELADPVVSPAYTPALDGTTNEIKIKYIADNQLKDLSGQSLEQEIKNIIREKDANLVGNMVSEGTTPRHVVNLLGSLCDLVTGSGDKGTPMVLVQGYFDNYSV